MSRMELETEVQDADVMESILTHLEFFPVVKVIKTRKYLRRDTITACLDQVDGLGDFLELEVVAGKENEREENLNKMEELLAVLEYKMSDTVRTSYLGMLQAKGLTAK